MSQTERKADTRRKIGLGGLVIKAGVADIDAMVLLGLLAEGRARLAIPGEYDRLQNLGRAMAKRATAATTNVKEVP
jgi:hypothetical protein